MSNTSQKEYNKALLRLETDLAKLDEAISHVQNDYIDVSNFGKNILVVSQEDLKPLIITTITTEEPTKEPSMVNRIKKDTTRTRTRKSKPAEQEENTEFNEQTESTKPTAEPQESNE